ncbi:MAG: 2-succinyl-5-enolpyruvyl-6-hydroxy-3-cyclohexene-1-carboxylic-acid synthase [Rhodothermales bacterium]|nr:2-succinyl-5-enolpyruvyl-6-hydroxy-3-cyclohexene-1-carboxylic-acid synthase [Rhodothermales bacterium]
MHWADLIVEELVRCGVEMFVMAPGSRSTPLVAAVAAQPRARAVMHYDERGTAFFALGYGRATRQPAAWITTSGTALANGYPAIVEAATDGVPMLLLTADRPPELRATGANQTIDQPGLFGAYVRWAFDLPASTPAIDPSVILTTVDQAVHRARRTPQGPVHLNCMFREPLAPEPEPAPEGAAGPLRWRTSAAPYTRYDAAPRRPDAGAVVHLAERLRAARRGLVVAGRLATVEEGRAALQLAERLGWPLLPDVGSQLRLGHGAAESVIPHYDLVLGSEAFADAHAPEAVVQVGARPTSKRLGQWLARHRPDPYVLVHDDPRRIDPHHHVTDRIEAGVAAFCAVLAEAVATPGDASWRAAWREADQRATAALTGALGDAEAISEPWVARAVARAIPSGHGLVLASSMPVRDVDMFAPADGAAVPVAANRGASGIDGLVATAAGFCEGRGAPATLLTGDLALLHDLNSLALLRERPVTVVAINNDGGGIFHFLPIARHEALFEPYFGTPHGLGFAHAAEMFGLPYARPATPAAFTAAYEAARQRDGASLIEVRTERAANAALHRRLLATAAAAVDRAG